MEHSRACQKWPGSGNGVRILSVGLPLVDNTLMEVPGALRFPASTEDIYTAIKEGEPGKWMRAKSV